MAREEKPEVPGGEPPAPPAEGHLVLATQVLPSRIPILPVRVRPYFPGFPVPIEIRGDQLAIVERAIQAYGEALGAILVLDEGKPDGPDNLRRVGTAGKLLRAVQADQETAHVLVNFLGRFTVEQVVTEPPLLVADVVHVDEPGFEVNDELRAYARAVVATLRDLVQLSPLQSEAIKLFLNRSALDEPGRLADFAANLTTASGEELQQILESFDVKKRIDRVLVLLKKEVELSKLQAQISRQIEEKISKTQREFFLHEQLKAIKKELGLEKEGKAAEIEKFKERLTGRDLGPEARTVVDEELQKLQLLEPASPEYAVSRNYLDWLTVLPWGIFSEDTFDVERARGILDRDHYGLEDVKERILEFIAVGKMKGSISGSILCLVGPPGVGKTSIGRSIAEAIGRRFFRFSLGGMRDEAEIKGHRRTYIGAMPGKFIQAMKSAGTSNPVVMLDEIDKIGISFQGDPAAALLEVLDPEQNATFRDHYLDVPFDLSNVLFISTANQLDTIPAPLLDRMEVIRLSGYILEEKVEIARRYLVPKALRQHGLKRRQVSVARSALVRIIDGYAREAGVRGLENQIKRIMRRAATRLAKAPSGTISLAAREVEEFLGKPVFSPDELFGRVPGVVTGLAWTSLGGATLQVEATAVPAKGKGFKQTGQLGEVMQESADIAYSYVMAHLRAYGASPTFFDDHFVHLHVPAGATPKDGPSAGVTMATALISMVKGKPVRSHLGMTGELTLTGQVLPIGGMKEKVIAAKRARLKMLIFPESNRKDFEELPAYLKKGLEVHFASRFEQIHALSFEKGVRASIVNGAARRKRH